jgi:hypothetical protein
VRYGITGHMDLTPHTVALVDREIREALSAVPPVELIGVSCLAAGADSLFARAVLDLGGALHVVLPSEDYQARKVKPGHRPEFDRLVRRALRVRTMPYETAGREAYEAANDAVLTSIDRLIAVWDGGSPADRGGTAAVVQEAGRRGIPVEVVWPHGARRAG